MIDEVVKINITKEKKNFIESDKDSFKKMMQEASRLKGNRRNILLYRKRVCSVSGKRSKKTSV